MADWNVNPSPLDGAVVGMREGGTRLYADVNKNSHFQPVCALTDRSKHYAQHRGRTTLDYSTEIIFSPSPESGEQCGQISIAGAAAAASRSIQVVCDGGEEPHLHHPALRF